MLLAAGRRHPRLEARRRSILPTNDLAASAHLSHPKALFDPASRQSSACPRDALVVDRQLRTLPAIVITRWLPRRRLWLPRLILRPFRLSLAQNHGTDLAVMLDPARRPFAG